MPNINALLWPTLFLASGLFALGARLIRKATSNRAATIWSALALVAVCPAMLYAIYYLHVLDSFAWFYALRIVPFSELAAAAAGLSAGALFALLRCTPFVKSSPLFRRLTPALIAALAAALIVVPYAKPMIVPLTIPLQDRWSDGVCIQTTPSTCGPASAATLLGYFGRRATEQTLARECFTCATGTENWYIARALRSRGIESAVRIMHAEPDSLPFPSIAGTNSGGKSGGGHFITILGEQDGRYLIGDPIGGRLLLTRDQIRKRYYLTGFFLVAREVANASRRAGAGAAFSSRYSLQGNVIVQRYRSTVLGSERRMHVYTPPGYDPKRAKAYPVLYLLHGEPGDDANWVMWGRLRETLDGQNASGRCEPFVVVMPNCDVPRRRFGPHGFEHELLRSLIPWIESRFHVRRDAAGRALAGFSMGGFQSVTIGLNHVDTFAWIGIFSAGLREKFASKSEIASAGTDPQSLRARLKLVVIRIGKRDFFLPDARRFHAWLTRRGIPCDYQEVPGTHEWPVWQGCLEDFAPQLFRENR